MTRKQALTDLLAKVEAGEGIKYAAYRNAFDGIDGRQSEMDYPILREKARLSFLGSLDAAKALHEAVLPGWVIHRIRQRHGGVWEVDLMQLGADGWHDPDVNKRVNVWGDEEARTRLIAIIKALIAEETQ